MNNQNFYLRLIALLLIIMAVFFYNGTVKDKEQAQDIADLTAKTESLENQQDQILTALKETYEEQKTAAENNITKTALMIIGDSVSAAHYDRSKLYDPGFTTEFREATK